MKESDMRSVVLETLRRTALDAAHYVPEPVDRALFPTDRLLFRCKGCNLIYTGSQVSPVEKIGHVCSGCQTNWHRCSCNNVCM